MIPKNSQVKLILMEMISDGKPHNKEEMVTYLSKVFNLTVSELLVKTRKGWALRFRNFVGWSIKDLRDIGVLKKDGKDYVVTKHGQRFCKLIIAKPIE